MKPTATTEPILFESIISFVNFIQPLYDSLRKLALSMAGVSVLGKEPAGECVYCYRPEPGLQLSGYQVPGSNRLQYMVVCDLEQLFKQNSATPRYPHGWHLFVAGIIVSELVVEKAVEHNSWAEPEWNKLCVVVYTKPNPFYSI